MQQRGKNASLLVSVVYLYMITVMFALPYYNWRYATENGFLKWLLWGETVPTAKALIWPYYALSHGTKHAGLETVSRRADVASLDSRKRWEAHNSAGTKEANQGHYSNAESEFKAALQEAVVTDPQGSDLAETLTNLGTLYYTEAKYAEAERGSAEVRAVCVPPRLFNAPTW
jgi:hypothetical protein